MLDKRTTDTCARYKKAPARLKKPCRDANLIINAVPPSLRINSPLNMHYRRIRATLQSCNSCTVYRTAFTTRCLSKRFHRHYFDFFNM